MLMNLCDVNALKYSGLLHKLFVNKNKRQPMLIQLLSNYFSDKQRNILNHSFQPVSKLRQK
ncbi:protein of unknown function [Shewanella benthica]|uniref:Uncharacterized protein n=1 Tax=Shewanella benthica TaxID=43661 RepID=A0A330M4I2_9GAMM|nr:protein of unknown function [Shewanella benthica]